MSLIIDGDVEGRKSGNDPDNIIENGNPVGSGKIFKAEACFFEQWIIQVYHQQGKPQVDGPDEGRIQDKPAGDGQLKNAPDDTHNGNDVL
jgi:hypothetical protein